MSMFKLINANTGTEMYVADNRVEEYLAAGHKLPAKPVKAAEKKPAKTKGK